MYIVYVPEMAEWQLSWPQHHLTMIYTLFYTPKKSRHIESWHKVLVRKERQKHRRDMWTNNYINSYLSVKSNQEMSIEMKRKWHKVTKNTTESYIFHSKSHRPPGGLQGMNHTEVLCGACENLWTMTFTTFNWKRSPTHITTDIERPS